MGIELDNNKWRSYAQFEENGEDHSMFFSQTQQLSDLVWGRGKGLGELLEEKEPTAEIIKS